ncbi:MAG: GNAT family N-acetyltransferase [Alsobacter sp.]
MSAPIPPARPAWRAMREQDLSGVVAIADVVHPSFPERIEVMAEKRALWPAGCFVLADAEAGLIGYAISHPWGARRPAPLDTLLGALPSPEGARWIHDVALLPAARGHGWAREPVRRILADADAAGAPEAALVAVYGSDAFWTRFGFRVPPDAPASLVAEVARHYGPQARFMVRPIGG